LELRLALINLLSETPTLKSVGVSAITTIR